MILKVKVDRKNPPTWKFFRLKGDVTVAEECLTDFEAHDQSPAKYAGLCEVFDPFLLKEDSERDLFPTVTDEEKKIMFNLEAYLLNDEGKTIEKIS